MGKLEKVKDHIRTLWLSQKLDYANLKESYAYVVRGKASLPCLYFIQWANYTCLYVHLLGLDSLNREKLLDSDLFNHSTSTSELHTCLMSMERLWDLFIQNFGITVEQRTILIQQCIGKLIEVKTIPLMICNYS